MGFWLGVLYGAVSAGIIVWQFQEGRREAAEFRAQEARDREWDRKHGIDAGGM